jgi:hypothetical protein
MLNKELNSHFAKPHVLRMCFAKLRSILDK